MDDVIASTMIYSNSSNQPTPLLYIPDPPLSDQNIQRIAHQIRTFPDLTQFYPMMTVKQWWFYPESGCYPFLEWDDLGAEEIGLLLRNAVITSCTAHDLLPDDAIWPDIWNPMIPWIATASAHTTRNGALGAVSLSFIKVAQDVKRTLDLRNLRPVPASPGHLMAEGSMLARARAEDTAHAAEVIFTEPVNAWTCLYMGRPARPGDMLMGHVTVEDTVKESTVDAFGKQRFVYKSKAVKV